MGIKLFHIVSKYMDVLKTKGLFRSKNFLNLDNVALSFVFGKYCPTKD
jgi:hypothetical protein